MIIIELLGVETIFLIVDLETIRRSQAKKNVDTETIFKKPFNTNVQKISTIN